ncbi:hypothetical protein BJ875DRAFT_409275 [Amylocarpus encephaloides]|uniref:Uncharacterized protein n=1 Tax=Amylocarpus encephaloides TaxID=45428 RepID=A0A9P8C1F1_9HELO|nr:hypothetical protein BJ875DRAFT_409275 [Amylocarpus encephaloides]
MPSHKASYDAPPPNIYRDEPDNDHAETASMASAVLLDDIESFPDEELPAYSDTPSEAPSSVPTSLTLARSTDRRDPFISEICPIEDLPFSTRDSTCSDYRTNYPSYSTEYDTLRNMITSQGGFPPGYMVVIQGEHTETSRQGNKESKNKIVDFYFKIEMSRLLVPAGHVWGVTRGKLEFLPDNKRGFRGTILPSLKPTVNDLEESDYLTSWCKKYVADKARIKSFTLKREIRNHDIKKLEQLIRSALSEANYRGHVHIKFPTNHDSVVVYSPGTINNMRMTTWIRWVFYLSFLWIITWPLLFFLTSRYDVVKSVWYYASKPPGDEMGREPTVVSEVDWFFRWESAIKRAALARIRCDDSVIDEEYRRATLAADQRGQEISRNPQPAPSTGNAFADGAFNLLDQGLRVAQGFSEQRGWGYDC